MAGFWRVGFIVGIGIAACACGGNSSAAGPAQGSEREACYPNRTCNAGLTCLSDVCVKFGGADSGGVSPVDGNTTPMPDAAAVAIKDATATMMTPDVHIVGAAEGGRPGVPLLDAKIAAFWFTINDCMGHPQSCTTGGNEAMRDFDGAPFCTKGTTAPAEQGNWGSGLVLGFYGSGTNDFYDATAAGVIGFGVDVTGKSPPFVTVDVQSVPVSPTLLSFATAGQAAPGTHADILLDQLETYPDSAAVDPSQLTLVSFSVPAGVDRTDFDYCVANVTAIMR